MTLSQLTTALRRFVSTDPHVVALCAAGITYDDAQETEAEYWRGVCDARETGLPYPRDPIARKILTEAAHQTVTAGFCSIKWDFSDGSVLTANDAGVMVR
jgi:hypothetical protein